MAHEGVQSHITKAHEGFQQLKNFLLYRRVGRSLIPALSPASSSAPSPPPPKISTMTSPFSSTPAQILTFAKTMLKFNSSKLFLIVLKKLSLTQTKEKLKNLKMKIR